MKKFGLLLLALIVMAGCQPDKKIQTVEIDKRYSIELPEFTSKTSGLNQDASLEYQNLAKEFYIIVIDEPIEEFHEAIIESDLADIYSPDFMGYSLYVSDLFLGTVDIYSESDFKEMTINKLKGQQKEVEGKVSGIEVYYHYTMVQGAKNYYQVLMWTLLSKKDEHKEQMDEIVNSFKEL
jgi:hypothetical protein